LDFDKRGGDGLVGFDGLLDALEDALPQRQRLLRARHRLQLRGQIFGRAFASDEIMSARASASSCS
jgi:hypothetical protein